MPASFSGTQLVMCVRFKHDNFAEDRPTYLPGHNAMRVNEAM